MAISDRDRKALRDLARQVADLAAQPIMAERREMWKQHNSLHRVRPMILISPEGSWRELLPQDALACEGDEARGIELNLRRRLYLGGLADDTVAEAEWNVAKVVRNSGWGLEPRRIASTEYLGAWTFDPVIRQPADLKGLRHPRIEVDEDLTEQRLAEAQDLFGDVLRVRLRGVNRVAFQPMAQYTRLRGLAEVMMDMVTQPAMLHDAMAFYEEGYRGMVRQHVEQNLLDLNNDGTYHATGGNGYTDELPRPDADPERVRPCDIWASAEAQEMAQVSPAMHHEFVMQYEKRLLAPFGLNGYGCCEDLTHKLDLVLTIPNIRRISISPWADVDACAAKLQDKYIFSWKPHPSHLVGRFDAAMIREYIRHTLDVTRGCVIEMILKDTHTCENKPERFRIWTEIARDLVAQY